MTVNRKTLTCAVIAELIIIGAIPVVNWSIAERGDKGEPGRCASTGLIGIACERASETRRIPGNA